MEVPKMETQAYKIVSKTKLIPTNKFRELYKGILLTLVLAIVASQIAKLPFFSIMGIMITSILVGAVWKWMMGIPVQASPGITFSSKVLLKTGIVLMGLKLNSAQIIEAGLRVITIDIIVIVFTLCIILWLGKLFNVDKHLTALIAVGSAVCGASAIVAVAPLIKSKKEHTALAVACIAVLGTTGAIIYVFIYPLLDLAPYAYGVLVGSTLHEVAHVVAAGVSGGTSRAEIAILTKLGRVALLIPVALILGVVFSLNDKTQRQEKKSAKDLPIPWFIFGFLAMIVVNSLQWIPASVTNTLIGLSVFFLSMAMAGLGLNINFSDFKKAGIKPFLVGVIGFAALAALGPFLLYLL